MVVPFDESLHPRGPGGKFGSKGGPQQGQRGRPAAERQQARLDREEARRLQVRLRGLLAQLEQLNASGPRAQRSHAKTAPRHQGGVKHQKATPKGSKSGLAKKTSTTKVSSAPTSTDEHKARIRAQVRTLRRQIHVLRDQARRLDQRAASGG